MIPVTGIVPVTPGTRPLEYLWLARDSAGKRKLSQPVPDTLNPSDSIRLDLPNGR